MAEENAPEIASLIGLFKANDHAPRDSHADVFDSFIDSMLPRTFGPIADLHAGEDVACWVTRSDELLTITFLSRAARTHIKVLPQDRSLNPVDYTITAKPEIAQMTRTGEPSRPKMHVQFKDGFKVDLNTVTNDRLAWQDLVRFVARQS